MLLPQQNAPPTEVTAHVWEWPADTDTAFDSTAWVPPEDTMTDTGVELDVVEEFPSCPLVFNPQHFTLPDCSTAHVWELPAETASAGSLAPRASTGVLVPLLAGPSSPLMPFPQHRTDPVVMTAHECSPPAVTDTAPVNTRFGVYVAPEELLPTHIPLRPKQYTVVSDFSTHVWSAPADTAVTLVSPGTRSGIADRVI